MEFKLCPNVGKSWYATKDYEIGNEILVESEPFFVAPSHYCQDMECSLSPVTKQLSKLASVFSAVFFKNPENNDIPKDAQSISSFVPLLVAFLALTHEQRLELLDQFFCPLNKDATFVSDTVDARHPLVRLTGEFAEKVATLIPEFKAINMCKVSVQRFLLIVLINATESMRLESHIPNKQPHLHPYIALYSRLSKFAHSCAPNCFVWSSSEQKDVIKVVALKQIKAGDVLAINYLFADDDIRAILPTRIRQRQLYYKKMFLCACTRCGLEDSLRTRTCKKCDTESAAIPKLISAPTISAGAACPTLEFKETFHCKQCDGTFTITPKEEEEEQKFEWMVEALSFQILQSTTSADVTSIIEQMQTVQRQIQQSLGKAHWTFHWLSPYVAMRLMYIGKSFNKIKELTKASNLVGAFLVYADDRIGKSSPHVMSRWALSNLKYLDTPLDIQIVLNIAEIYKPYQKECFQFLKAHQEALDLFVEKAKITIEEIKSDSRKKAAALLPELEPSLTSKQ